MDSAEVSQYDSTGTTLQSHKKSTYRYDDSGIRVAKTELDDVNNDGDFDDLGNDTSERTDYHVDHRNPTGYAQVLEEMQGDTVVKSYTIGHDVFLEAVAANETRRLLKDGHGSTRLLVDAQGNVIANGTTPQVFAYDAYGLPIGFDLAAALTTHLYSGERTDQLTGLQYLRARYYNPATGTFNRLDPFAGNISDPQSLHKYLYTHGDPIRFADPSGLFEGLAGILSSMNIQMNNRANQAPGHAKSVHSVRRLEKMVELVQKLHGKLQQLEDALDLFDNATNILELTKLERKELKNSFNVLAVLPNVKTQITVALPAKVTRKLRQFIRLARNFGGLHFLQEQVGEWGAAIAANAAGLEHTKMKLHSPQGIDQLRHHTQLGFWAIVEAKGGTSRLGNASYGREMSPKWIRHWLNDTIDRNYGHPERHAAPSQII